MNPMLFLEALLFSLIRLLFLNGFGLALADLLIFGIIVVTLVVARKFWKTILGQDSLIVYLAVICGWFPLFALLMFLLGLYSGIPLLPNLLLSFPFPGLVSSLLAIVLGSISFQRKESNKALLAAILGVVAIIMTFVFSIGSGGFPFACYSNEVCKVSLNNIPNGYSSCQKYLGSSENSIGVCVVEYTSFQ